MKWTVRSSLPSSPTINPTMSSYETTRSVNFVSGVFVLLVVPVLGVTMGRTGELPSTSRRGKRTSSPSIRSTYLFYSIKVECRVPPNEQNIHSHYTRTNYG